MDDKVQKNLRISHAEIASVAAAGVSRAMAARNENMRELNPTEIMEVSGGAFALALKDPIIYGGNLVSLVSKLATPTVDVNQSIAGANMLRM